MTMWICGDTERPSVTVTPRILVVCTRLSSAISADAENFSFRLLSENNISWLFAILRVKLFACARWAMLADWGVTTHQRQRQSRQIRQRQLQNTDWRLLWGVSGGTTTGFHTRKAWTRSLLWQLCTGRCWSWFRLSGYRTSDTHWALRAFWSRRAYAICVCRLWVTLCIVAKRCVIERTYYWQPIGCRVWEIDWYQNEWPWLLFRGRLRSCQPLHHIRLWISRKLLEIDAWFQRKWPTGINWSRDRWRHLTPKSQTRDSNMLRAKYLENGWG